MPGKSAAWRMSDVAAYDVAVELAHTLTAELLRSANGTQDVSADIVCLRAELQLVDPYDRSAVDEFVQSLEQRIEQVRA